MIINAYMSLGPTRTCIEGQGLLVQGTEYVFRAAPQ